MTQKHKHVAQSLPEFNRRETPNSPPKAPEALRFDADKLRFDLIPHEAMEALARHYTVGARKYEDRNWEKGMAWCRCFASLMRHAWAWMRGEDIDEETGSDHMIAIAWNALTIYTYRKRQIGNDDRPILPQPE